MALTITIGGADFKPQYKTGTLHIKQTIQHQADICTLEIRKKSGENAPTEGKEIIVKDGSRFLFGGFITRTSVVETGKNDLFMYKVEATDYSYVLINKTAQVAYTNQTLQYIVQDLLSQYVNSGYSFTTANVDVGPTIETITFNHISLRKCFEKLANVTGYEWWVDYSRDVHFKAPDSLPAPESLTDSLNNHTGVAITCDFTQVRNSIVVQGGEEEIAVYESQFIKGDGVATSFFLEETPTAVQYVKLNGVSKTFDEDPNDEIGLYFMYNKTEKYVRVVAGNPTPSLTDTIEISYKYSIPVLSKVKSAASVLAMKALEGGDGVHDFTITDISIKSAAEARLRALKELDQYSNPLIIGSFNTRSDLLTAGSIFSPGQLLTVNLPQWGIVVDTTYLIQQVDVTLSEDGTNIIYTYDVRFGGRLLNAATFLNSLAGKEDVLSATEQVTRIELIAEDVVITESITRNNNVKNIVESMSISESISKTNVTPPYKWGVNGTANKGVWGKSEWS